MLVKAGANLDLQNNVSKGNSFDPHTPQDKKTAVEIAKYKLYPRGVQLLEVFVVRVG
jgi:hypothetical protein